MPNSRRHRDGKKEVLIAGDLYVHKGIDAALTYMQLADPTLPGIVPISHHDGAILVNTGLVETIVRNRGPVVKNRNSEVINLVKKVDVSIAFPIDSKTDDGLACVLQLERGRELDFAEKSRLAVKGYHFSKLSRVLEAVGTDVLEDGTYKSHREYYILVGPDRCSDWKPLIGPLEHRRRCLNPHERTFFVCRLVSTYADFQALRDASWSVSLAYPGSHSVTYLTDPIGVRELFRSRDVPDGRSRRQALKHWVSEHYRQVRADPAVETQVRACLRGQTSFTWYGLNARIHVPSVDLVRIEGFRQEREAARREHRDRRPRLPR